MRPISLYPFPTEVLQGATRAARAVVVYENSAGQMIDDVRLALLGTVPVEFIGGLTMDSSAFGVGPDLQVPIIRKRIVDACRRAGYELGEGF